MSDTTLEDAILAYLAKDDADDPEFQSLTTIYESAPVSRWKRTFSRAEQGIEDKEALRVALDQLVADGMAERRWGERDYEASYRVSRDGFYEAVLGSKYVVQSEEGEKPGAERPIFDEGVFDPEIFDTGDQQAQSGTIHSAAWTGISRVRIDARNAQAISRLIDAALNELPQDDNVTVAQARTLLLAAKQLTDAPDPPSDIIWELIQRAGAVVGLLDIFVRIFVGLTQ